MIAKMIVALGLACLASSAAVADWKVDHDALVDFAQENPLTSSGVWLEMRNAFNEWEKMILIFGYAGAGDEAACEEIIALAGDQNPDRIYRCSPVS
ncbi:hypothetical protein [Salipiger sp.]|uniref:hypothetical protein n=1 Tax=Salipiger sp. TaxID=2078585 RepID=UPI003A96A532